MRVSRVLACAVAALSVFVPAASAAPLAQQIVVGFEDGVSGAERAEIRRGADVEVLQSSRLASEQLVALDGDAGSRREALERLRARDGVAFAEPNFPAYAQSLPNDPSFADQWGLRNTANLIVGGVTGVPDADIDAEEAWAVQPGLDGLFVGVADSGLATGLGDLPAGARWSNPGEIAGNGVDDDGNGFVDDVHGWDFAYNDAVPEEDIGHGTMVSSVIAARRNNGVGVAGLAPATIVPAKIFSSSGVGTSWAVAQSMRYLARQGTRVVNLSVGISGADPVAALAAAAVDYPDTLFVFAAGNSGRDADDPDRLMRGQSAQCKTPGDNVLCVGASRVDDGLAAFSNYGATSVDLLAPGEAIRVLQNSDTASWANGTSFAAPMVTGVAALLVSHAPAATAPQLARAIRDGGDVVAAARGTTVTGRRLNARRALQALAAGPITVEAPQVTGTTVAGSTLTATPGAWMGASAYRHQWLRCHPTVERCWAIEGARATSYPVTSSDRGFRLRVSVVAAAASGATQALSAMTDAVPDVPPLPAVTSPGSIAGTTAPGDTLTATWAVWQDAVSITRVWERCDAALAACSAEQDDGATYASRISDAGSRLRLRETATNAAGSTTTTSVATAVLDVVAGEFTIAPTLTGDTAGRAEVGTTLRVGGWQFSGRPVTSTQVQWFSCASVTPCTEAAAPVATASQYTAASTNYGQYLHARVVITQPGGITRTSRVVSLQHAVGAGAPRIEDVQIIGTPRIGETLHAQATIDAFPEAVRRVRWERCDPFRAVCDEWRAQTSPQTTITDDDAGLRLRAVVIAENAFGATQRTSAATAVILARPRIITAGAGGTAAVGFTLTATASARPETAAVQITWVRCRTAAADTCSAPNGRHGPTVTLTAGDEGAYLRAITVAREGDLASDPMTLGAIGPVAPPPAPPARLAAPAPTITRQPQRPEPGGRARDAEIARSAVSARSVKLSGNRLSVRCDDDEPCRLTVRITHGSRLLASGAATVNPGRGTIVMRPTAHGRRTLSGRGVTARIRVTFGDTTITRRVTLRAR